MRFEQSSSPQSYGLKTLFASPKSPPISPNKGSPVCYGLSSLFSTPPSSPTEASKTVHSNVVHLQTQMPPLSKGERRMGSHPKHRGLQQCGKPVAHPPAVGSRVARETDGRRRRGWMRQPWSPSAVLPRRRRPEGRRELQALLEGATMEGSRHGEGKRRSKAEQGSPPAAAGNLDSSSFVLIRSHPPSICRLPSSIWPLPPQRRRRDSCERRRRKGQSPRSSPRASPVPPPSPPLVPVASTAVEAARCWRRSGKEAAAGVEKTTGEGGGRGVEAAAGEEEADTRWRQRLGKWRRWPGKRRRTRGGGRGGRQSWVKMGERRENTRVRGTDGCELQNEGGDAGAVGSDTVFLCCSF